MYITRLQLNIGSGLSDSIIDGCFTTTCGGLLRLRLGWKIILVVVFIVVVAIVGIVSIRIVVKVILICWKIRGFMIVSHRNWNKIFPWLKNIIFSLSIHSNYLLFQLNKTLFSITQFILFIHVGPHNF